MARNEITCGSKYGRLLQTKMEPEELLRIASDVLSLDEYSSIDSHDVYL